MTSRDVTRRRNPHVTSGLREQNQRSPRAGFTRVAIIFLSGHMIDMLAMGSLMVPLISLPTGRTATYGLLFKHRLECDYLPEPAHRSSAPVGLQREAIMAKAMIFLFDGTGNDATVDSFSNVYAINQLIADTKRKKSGSRYIQRPQVTFYLPGVGTQFTVKRPKRNRFGRWDKVRQQIFGDNLEQLIIRAYVNLCANYAPEDDIILIGFSRGGVAARIFSRLISDFGILRSEMLSLLDRLWNEFVEISSIQSDDEYSRNITSLKGQMASTTRDGLSAFHNSVEKPIKFIGVFDTVIGSEDVMLPKNVDFRDSFPARGVNFAAQLLSMHDIRGEFQYKKFKPVNFQSAQIRQIWVPGVHSDIGGGYRDDFISNICLLTMADLLREHGDISLDRSAVDDLVNKVRESVRRNRLKVNKEPFVINVASRADDILASEEIHPLHWYLVGKQILWKDDSFTDEYENRHEVNAPLMNKELEALFNSWVSPPAPRRQKRS
ncbi:MAG: DUF2235 domain-containing protein [Mesorhizobium sp.]|nr:MAG: DUF2235 domain-containing protein [Mesorhizobium sp.]